MRATVIALVVFGIFSAASAQPRNQPPPTERLSAAQGTLLSLRLDEHRTAATRKVAAQAIREYCDAYLSFIPRLSPREEEWIASELKSRRYSVLESREYLRQTAIWWFSTCATTSEEIVTGRFQQGNELFYWTKLAAHLLLPRAEYAIVNAGFTARQAAAEAGLMRSVTHDILVEVVARGLRN
jgi:hypothetical protein